MKIVIPILFLVTICACSGNEKELPVEMQVDLMAMPPSSEQPNPNTIEVAKVPDRKLIKNGYMEFETADIGQTRRQIEIAVEASRGYISKDEERNEGDKMSYTLVLRVPAAAFDTFLVSATRGVRYFDSKSIDVEDVTARYVDTETRLKSKREIESRYLQLLKKASNVKDILQIEKESGTIRTEIESAEGQLKLLNDEIQYSALRVKFYKITSTPTVFSFQLYSAFIRGWENFLAGLLALINIWPFIIFLAVFCFGAKKVFDRRKKLFTAARVGLEGDH